MYREGMWATELMQHDFLLNGTIFSSHTKVNCSEPYLEEDTVHVLDYWPVGLAYWTTFSWLAAFQTKVNLGEPKDDTVQRGHVGSTFLHYWPVGLVQTCFPAWQHLLAGCLHCRKWDIVSYQILYYLHYGGSELTLTINTEGCYQ